MLTYSISHPHLLIQLPLKSSQRRPIEIALKILCVIDKLTITVQGSAGCQEKKPRFMLVTIFSKRDVEHRYSIIVFGIERAVIGLLESLSVEFGRVRIPIKEVYLILNVDLDMAAIIVVEAEVFHV